MSSASSNRNEWAVFKNEANLKRKLPEKKEVNTRVSRSTRSGIRNENARKSKAEHEAIDGHYDLL